MYVYKFIWREKIDVKKTIISFGFFFFIFGFIFWKNNQIQISKYVSTKYVVPKITIIDFFTPIRQPQNIDNIIIVDSTSNQQISAVYEWFFLWKQAIMSFLAPKSAISHQSNSPRKQSLRGSSTSLQSNEIPKLERSRNN